MGGVSRREWRRQQRGRTRRERQGSEEEIFGGGELCRQGQRLRRLYAGCANKVLCGCSLGLVVGSGELTVGKRVR